MRPRLIVSSLAAIALLAGCVTVPTGPRVAVMPGHQKSLEQFNADNWNCRQYAASLFDPNVPAQAAVNNAAAGALLGAAAGAIIGAATGQAGPGAAIGAGTGLLFGSAAGANAAGWSSYEAQRQYDVAYMQCMYAHGNQVPGRRVVYTGAASGYPPPNQPPPAYAAPGSRPPPGAAYPPPNQPPPNVAPGSPGGPVYLAPGMTPPAGSAAPPPNQPPPPGVTTRG